MKQFTRKLFLTFICTAIVFSLTMISTVSSDGSSSSICFAAAKKSGKTVRSGTEESADVQSEDTKLSFGKDKVILPNGDEPITLYTYKPEGYKDGPLIIVFHGISRDAQDYRSYAISIAERFGAIVVAPLFDARRFSIDRYQQGGIVSKSGDVEPSEKWTYAIVPKIAEHIRKIEGRKSMPYYLIGHSAGGQFLVRLAAFMPGEAVRIVTTNPGSALFPVTNAKYPYGFGRLPDELSNDTILRAYLSAPLTIYLGTGDIYPKPHFDDSRLAMKQGFTRLARGRACFEFAKKLAKEQGWTFNWRKVETPGIGHDASGMFEANEVEEALFGNKKEVHK